MRSLKILPSRASWFKYLAAKKDLKTWFNLLWKLILVHARKPRSTIKCILIQSILTGWCSRGPLSFVLSEWDLKTDLKACPVFVGKIVSSLVVSGISNEIVEIINSLE